MKSSIFTQYTVLTVFFTLITVNESFAYEPGLYTKANDVKDISRLFERADHIFVCQGEDRFTEVMSAKNKNRSSLIHMQKKLDANGGQIEKEFAGQDKVARYLSKDKHRELLIVEFHPGAIQRTSTVTASIQKLSNFLKTLEYTRILILGQGTTNSYRVLEDVQN